MLYLFTKLVKFWYTNKQKVAKIALFYVVEMSCAFHFSTMSNLIKRAKDSLYKNFNK